MASEIFMEAGEQREVSQNEGSPLKEQSYEISVLGKQVGAHITSAELRALRFFGFRACRIQSC